MNLLDDHLVDVLLDSAAGGWNTVEREALRECFIGGALSTGMHVKFPENTNDNVDTCMTLVSLSIVLPTVVGSTSCNRRIARDSDSARTLTS